MHSKEMGSGSKDLINDLPEALLCHILSFLTTKEAASTSILSRRWRYLLAYVQNLEFDDSIYLHPEKRVENPLAAMGLHGFEIFINDKRMKLSTSFPDLVDRILDLQGNSTVNKFSLKLVDQHDPVDPDCAIPWILNVLVRGVSDLYLAMDLGWASWLPSRIFLSQTLVRLRIHGCTFDLEDVHLPNLKNLYLERILFEEGDVGFSKLMSGCRVLEELVSDKLCSSLWKSFSVSVTTLKRLTFHWDVREENPCSVSFDTPNLVFLEYTEVFADKHPKVNFESLVEAKIDLRMTEDQTEEVRYPDEANALELDDQFIENIMVDCATDFIFGIRNVQILYLSANILEVLRFCCISIPIFNNLTHLTIQSNPEVGWESLPGLLKNCPNLETLVFQGLLHRASDSCRDVLLCRSREEDVPTFLSSSTVKVLKIVINDDDNIEKQIEEVNHFLHTMPHLEPLILYCDSTFEGDVKVSTQLEMLTRIASPKCKVHLIFRNLCVPSTKWGPLL